jgi:hypothetical protein
MEGILENLIKQSENMFDELHKNSNILSEMLHIECIDYNIKENDIEMIKNNFIENIKIFSYFLNDLSFSEIDEYSFEQLIDILKDLRLNVFDIKKLYPAQIQDSLEKLEHEMYKTCIELFQFNRKKIEFYDDFYENIYIKNFIEKLNYHETVEIDKIKIDEIKIDEIQIDKLEQVRNDILSHNTDKISTIELSDLYYTLWDKNVLLYEFKNNINFHFIYVYFDIFNRVDKKETERIIKMNNKKTFVICLNSYDKDKLNNYISELKNLI